MLQPLSREHVPEVDRWAVTKYGVRSQDPVTPGRIVQVDVGVVVRSIGLYEPLRKGKWLRPAVFLPRPVGKQEYHGVG